MKKQFALILILSLVIFISCNPENKEWKVANKANTVESYSDFTEKYPEHTHTKELKTALTELINSGDKNLFVLYDNFRLRDKPDLGGELLQKMSINSEVEILEKSNTKEAITVAGHLANSYWYKLKIKDVTGWTFGAGIGCSSDIYDACNLYLTLFPDETLENFEHCETMFWVNKAIDDNDLESYEFHLKNFAEGIYKDETKSIIDFFNINDLIVGKWEFVKYEDNVKRSKKEKVQFYENMKSFLNPFSFEFLSDNICYEILGDMTYPCTWEIDIEKRILKLSGKYDTDYTIDKFDAKNLILDYKSKNTISKYYFEKQD